MPDWDPERYLEFGDHRLRPALELLARIPSIEARTVWDLGCGTGAVTPYLKQRYPTGRVFGLDSSPEMLERAASIPGVVWVHGDIADWRPAEPADVVYCNAALQWVPDHDALFPRLMEEIAPGGILAVQMPANWDEPSHRLLVSTARSRRWAGRFEDLPGPHPIAPPGRYYDLVAPLAVSLDLWETVYTQVLEGDNPVASWTRGTTARLFLERAGDEAEAFFSDYSAAVERAYPRRSDGRTLFRFRRLFLVARR